MSAEARCRAAEASIRPDIAMIRRRGFRCVRRAARATPDIPGKSTSVMTQPLAAKGKSASSASALSKARAV